MAKKYFVGVDLGGTSMRAGVVAKDGAMGYEVRDGDSPQLRHPGRTTGCMTF